MKRLKTFAGVVDALGGIQGTALAARRSTQCVTNWRRRGYFPTELWFVLDKALAAEGAKADKRLFRFELPQGRGQ